jgi:4-carboxymuconolactone decarboxylase
MSNSENGENIFPKGERTNPDYFTGIAWLNTLVAKDETGTYAVGCVSFEPGGKTNWHTHPAGQILLVTDGKGFYQEKGKPARVIAKGDVVVIPSVVEHWHGASNNNHMTHIAITNNINGVAVNWLSPVTDEEYRICNSIAL